MVCCVQPQIQIEEVGVLPIRKVKSNVSSVAPFVRSKRLTLIYFPYQQYTDFLYYDLRGISLTTFNGVR